jgi:hypothetical protein
MLTPEELRTAKSISEDLRRIADALESLSRAIVRNQTSDFDGDAVIVTEAGL